MDQIMKKIVACQTDKLERVTDLLRRNLSPGSTSKTVLTLGALYLSGTIDSDGVGCLRVPYTITATGDGNIKEGELVVATSILVGGFAVHQK
jgi:hypothetical protein